MILVDLVVIIVMSCDCKMFVSNNKSDTRLMSNVSEF